MSDTTNPDEDISVIVEQITNIQAWIPVLIEMINKDCIVEVYSSVPFNDDYTDLLIGTVDQSNYSIQINTTVQEFNKYLDFFAEKTKEGDIISVWKSFEELNELIDEKAEMDE